MLGVLVASQHDYSAHLTTASQVVSAVVATALCDPLRSEPSSQPRPAMGDRCDPSTAGRASTRPQKQPKRPIFGSPRDFGGDPTGSAVSKALLSRHVSTVSAFPFPRRGSEVVRLVRAHSAGHAMAGGRRPRPAPLHHKHGGSQPTTALGKKSLLRSAIEEKRRRGRENRAGSRGSAPADCGPYPGDVPRAASMTRSPNFSGLTGHIACFALCQRRAAKPETRRNGLDAAVSPPYALRSGSRPALVVAGDPWPSIG